MRLPAGEAAKWPQQNSSLSLLRMAARCWTKRSSPSCLLCATLALSRSMLRGILAWRLWAALVRLAGCLSWNEALPRLASLGAICCAKAIALLRFVFLSGACACARVCVRCCGWEKGCVDAGMPLAFLYYVFLGSVQSVHLMCVHGCAVALLLFIASGE